MNKLTGYRVLVVEDDTDLRELIAEDFSISGAKVTMAESGKSALEILKTQDFEFVLSDFRMPNGDGKFLAKEILSLKQGRLPLFLYSGYNEIKNEEAEQLGILKIFNKPCEFSEMLEIILLQLQKLKSVT